MTREKVNSRGNHELDNKKCHRIICANSWCIWYGCIGVQNVSDYALKTTVATRNLFVKFRLFAGDFLGESPILFLFTEQFCCVDWICSIFLLHVFTGFVFCLFFYLAMLLHVFFKLKAYIFFQAFAAH